MFTVTADTTTFRAGLRDAQRSVDRLIRRMERWGSRECAKAKLRVKIKSLTEEARIIRQEVRRQTDPDVKNVLSEHRKGVVRTESRLAQLAYAFFRQVPYKVVEPKTHHPVEVARLIKQVKRMDWSATDEAVKAWYQA